MIGGVRREAATGVQQRMLARVCVMEMVSEGTLRVGCYLGVCAGRAAMCRVSVQKARGAPLGFRERVGLRAAIAAPPRL